MILFAMVAPDREPARSLEVGWESEDLTSFSMEIVNHDTAETGDAALLGDIAQGDREAFARFYDRYSGLLFSMILKILNDHKEAEDILQEVFLQIWNKAGNYQRSLGAPLSWVLTLARNKSIDRLRASQRRYRFSEEIKVEVEAVSATDLRTSEDVFDREKAAQIRAALQALPVEQRQAIEMAFFGGLTQNEISESLHEPLGTVKARIRRGMLKLRDSLQRQL